jgi:hypothetical protein
MNMRAGRAERKETQREKPPKRREKQNAERNGDNDQQHRGLVNIEL